LASLGANAIVEVAGSRTTVAVKGANPAICVAISLRGSQESDVREGEEDSGGDELHLVDLEDQAGVK
jgi:hypothetical protein